MRRGHLQTHDQHLQFLQIVRKRGRRTPWPGVIGSEQRCDYPPNEVQAMTQRVASEVATSVWSVRDEEVADKLTLHSHSITGDDDVAK